MPGHALGIFLARSEATRRAFSQCLLSDIIEKLHSPEFVKEQSGFLGWRRGVKILMRNRWRQFASHKVRLRWWQAIALAVFCVLAATLTRVLFISVTETSLQFPFYFLAVLCAALFGGLLSGLTAIVLSILISWWVFFGQPFHFDALTMRDTINLAIFAASSLLIVWLAVVHRRLILQYEKQEWERSLLVGEIQHRDRNILTVVEMLVRQTIADKDEALSLINRIRAATDMQDVLDSSSAHAVNLREVLAPMLKPYGSRAVLDGPSIMLSASTARALRLVFHEMVTNALKYGALSETDGKISVEWMLKDETITIRWCEIDGPKVSVPSKYNFGSKLIVRILKQLNARFEPTFAETGYCYKIELPYHGHQAT